MDIAAQKAELIEWISTLTDEAIIKDILAVKVQKEFDFEREWARSISGDELRKRTKQHINSINWKKS
jgi:hypothetical protein